MLQPDELHEGTVFVHARSGERCTIVDPTGSPIYNHRGRLEWDPLFWESDHRLAGDTPHPAVPTSP